MNIREKAIIKNLLSENALIRNVQAQQLFYSDINNCGDDIRSIRGAIKKTIRYFFSDGIYLGKFDEIYQSYNLIQKEQGMDLLKWRGKRCMKYSYNVLNYPAQQQNIRLNLLVCGGKIIGGDEVSKKHANFIIIVGGATGEDILSQITEVQNKVKEKYGIELKVEQEFVE